MFRAAGLAAGDRDEPGSGEVKGVGRRTQPVRAVGDGGGAVGAGRGARATHCRFEEVGAGPGRAKR